jgi:hypothetical protein
VDIKGPGFEPITSSVHTDALALTVLFMSISLFQLDLYSNCSNNSEDIKGPGFEPITSSVTHYCGTDHVNKSFSSVYIYTAIAQTNSVDIKGPGFEPVPSRVTH